jgi:hypothetical protein
MKKAMSLLFCVGTVLLTGCVSIESINNKILPVSKWYEQEYEETRFTQRYKFTRTDIDTVHREIVNSLPQIGMTVIYATDDIVATGNPTTMFTTSECESWANVDREKTKQLSGGMINLTCNSSNKNSIITVTINLKTFPSGTLIVLDYETKNPKFDAYGLRAPRRPPPAASKAGASKFWDVLARSLPYPVHNATKDDLL